MPHDDVRLLAGRPRRHAVHPLRHADAELARHAATTAEPEDETVGRAGALGLESRLADVRVADAPVAQRVEQAHVEAADERTRPVRGEEPRPVDDQPLVPVHRRVFTQRPVQRRLQPRLHHLRPRMYTANTGTKRICRKL